MTWLSTTTHTGEWVGHQVLSGPGYGLAFQMPFIAVHAALGAKDLAVGNATATFFNGLGSAIAVLVTESVFTNELWVCASGYSRCFIRQRLWRRELLATGFRGLVAYERERREGECFLERLINGRCGRGFLIAVVFGGIWSGGVSRESMTKLRRRMKRKRKERPRARRR